MALIIEMGEGVSGAESYTSVSQFRTYANARGYEIGPYSDDEIEQAARRGTAYIDATFSSRFLGYRTGAGSQALEFPRTGIYDAAGYAIAPYSIPVELIRATCEATWIEVVTPGALTKPIKAGGGVVKRVKAGSVEVEFGQNGSTSTEYPIIALTLVRLIGSSSPYSGSLVRA